jgi:hypothetical protein
MNRTRRWSEWVLVGLFYSLTFSGLCQGMVWYVDDDAPAGGDGSSWYRAYRYLQDALAVAVPGDEIRVAVGIYRPDQGSHSTAQNRNESFSLLSGVVIRGGAQGRYSGNPNITHTVLSGDLKGNDGDTYLKNARFSDNAYHVVTAAYVDSSAVLEGVTITEGYGSYQKKGGAGLYVQAASPTIRHCLFEQNDAKGSGLTLEKQGDHIWCESSSPCLAHCIFKMDNTNVQGILVDLGHPTLNNCRFEFQVHHAIGLCLMQGTMTIDQCSFVNTGPGKQAGRGILKKLGGATVSGCQFTANATGIENRKGDLTLVDCHFQDNNAGLRTTTNSNDKATKVARSVFINNNTALSVSTCHIKVNNCRFYANDRAFYGAKAYQSVIQSLFVGNNQAIHCQRGSLDVLSCTFTQNGTNKHYPVSAGLQQALSMRNCIVGEASRNWLIYKHNTKVDIAYCCEPYGFSGTGNLIADPLFMRLPYDGGDGWGDNLNSKAVDEGDNDDFGDLRLKQKSPCIESGDNTAVPVDVVVDLDGNPRISESQVDIGAFEYISTHYYNLFTQVLEGHGRIEPGSTKVADGERVTLHAIPDDWYGVYAWLGTDDDSSRELTNTVTIEGADKYVWVEFEPYFTIFQTSD